ncbi:MAG: type III secretion system export apparatus subunit SctR [Candidatus Adiutrix sp.]|jgi:type III secretion protein R|nr:type III secretion system export apparatus subunit SctR [Candidatus Adiutrix sp.]
MITTSPVTFILLMAALGLMPFFLMMVTSYVKIVVVTTLVRNALGVQQVPPAMVLNGLAMVLTLFVMAPVALDTWKLAKGSGLDIQSDASRLVPFLAAASPPLKGFLDRNTDRQTLSAFKSAAQRLWPPEYRDGIDEAGFLLLIPAFVITELTKAFKIGFLLYMPFIVIDLVISNILLAMGMMMVSPMTISLPFKLLLFVTLDGWLKISQGLMYSYN